MDDEDQSELLALQLEVEDIDSRLELIGQKINDFLTKQERLGEEKKKLLTQINQLQKRGPGETQKLSDWKSDSFPWSGRLKEVMSESFHMSTFRALQKETMNVTLSKRDCILIMPTGGGKSLSFQVPALMEDGLTLVISPLVALMEDQLIALRKLNINAAMLSASSPASHNSEVLAKMIMKKSDLKLLYVTPERLAKSKRFMAKMEKAYSLGNIARIVIDEVHCTSNWGHDFRPDYKILGILKRQFPDAPLLGLTATASEKVLADVKDILNLDRRCVVFRASFNRPNLFYEVYKTSLEQKLLIGEIAKRIKLEFKNMSGIIYCFSRKDSEEVASQLVSHGIQAHCYHSDLPAALKTSVHEAWICGDVQVVVATIAFGMGIDKPNVRFVIHFSISKSMENYYQESGRAGRDDKKAWCILYFRFQDIFRQCAMVFTEKTGLENLHHMLRYSVDRRKCRRTLIGKHFAEQWKASECKQMCDNCQRDQDAMRERDLGVYARELLDILDKASLREERLTPIKLIDNWLGKCKVNIRPKVLCTLPRDECEDMVTKLLIDQILREDFHFTPYNTITYVVAGSRWPMLKLGKISVKMDVIGKTKTSPSKVDSKPVDKSKPLSTNKANEKVAKKSQVVVVDVSEVSEASGSDSESDSESDSQSDSELEKKKLQKTNSKTLKSSDSNKSKSNSTVENKTKSSANTDTSTTTKTDSNSSKINSKSSDSNGKEKTSSSKVDSKPVDKSKPLSTNKAKEKVTKKSQVVVDVSEVSEASESDSDSDSESDAESDAELEKKKSHKTNSKTLKPPDSSKAKSNSTEEKSSSNSDKTNSNSSSKINSKSSESNGKAGKCDVVITSTCAPSAAKKRKVLFIDSDSDEET